jgi:DNA-binding MarR family transcriptional regulator
MVTKSTGEENVNKDRDLRLRQQFFPDIGELLFDTASKGYGPLPILLRKVLRHISGPELRVLIYLYTRASKYRICYPTMEEIAEELDIHRKNLAAPLKALEKTRLIATHSAGGKRYYVILDPRVAIQHLVDAGTIKGDELFMINELARELKQKPFQPAAKVTMIKSAKSAV